MTKPKVRTQTSPGQSAGASGVASPAIVGSDRLPENGTVTVGLKTPAGIILRVFRMVDAEEPVMGGGVRSYKRAQDVGQQVVIKGYGEDLAKIKAPLPVIGQYALTPNVDAQFFRAWMDQNKDSELVKNGLIFAHKSEHSASDTAKERADLRSGFEPLNPKSKNNSKQDPRIGRAGSPFLTPIETLETRDPA